MRVETGPSWPATVQLLRDCGLPSDDLTVADLANFSYVQRGGATVGVVGLQLLGKSALLRSLAVMPASRRDGLGRTLVEAAERRALAQGVDDLYLLTNDAQRYFAGHGYSVVDRSQAPQAIRSTAQFGSCCCARATLMHKSLR